MRIIISAGFPYANRGNFIHSEQQGDDLFVSKELLRAIREYLLKKDIADFERFVVLHRDHTADYTSIDRKDKH